MDLFILLIVSDERTIIFVVWVYLVLYESDFLIFFLLIRSLVYLSYKCVKHECPRRQQSEKFTTFLLFLVYF